MIAESKEVYRAINGCELRMHLYLPDRKFTPKSGIVFFFGGGWMEGAPSHFASQSKRLADLGIVAACAEYRIFNRHGTTPFDAVSDAKAAVRWMRQNASRLEFPSNRLAAAGGSAGGHLAVCTAVISGFEEPGIFSNPDALILFNPVLDTTERGYGLERVTATRKTEISPYHHIREGLPPTLIQHGEADEVVPFENALRFTQKMNAMGNRCDLVAYPGRGHGFFNRREGSGGAADSDFETTLAASVTFLREIGFLEDSSR